MVLKSIDNMKAEKLYDFDKVAKEWATYYINNNSEFKKFTKKDKERIIDAIKNMMVQLAVSYESKF